MMQRSNYYLSADAEAAFREYLTDQDRAVAPLRQRPQRPQRAGPGPPPPTASDCGGPMGGGASGSC